MSLTPTNTGPTPPSSQAVGVAPAANARPASSVGQVAAPGRSAAPGVVTDKRAAAVSKSSPAATQARPQPSSPSQPAATATPPPTGTAAIWASFFKEWIEGVPKRGIVVNNLNEQIPFKSFMLRGEVVMLERLNPDSLGARYLIVPFTEITLVKLTDPIRQEVFDKAGFTGKLSG